MVVVVKTVVAVMKTAVSVVKTVVVVVVVENSGVGGEIGVGGEKDGCDDGGGVVGC